MADEGTKVCALASRRFEGNSLLPEDRGATAKHDTSSPADFERFSEIGGLNTASRPIPRNIAVQSMPPRHTSDTLTSTYAPPPNKRQPDNWHPKP